jgi:hypothetical protein
MEQKMISAVWVPTLSPETDGFAWTNMGIGTTALNMSTPIPSREFQPKGLNFEESTTPSNYLLLPKGVKRNFDFIDCSQNWSMQNRFFLIILWTLLLFQCKFATLYNSKTNLTNKVHKRNN